MLHIKDVEGDKKIGNEFGRLGEDIACIFLKKKEYKIIERNYRKKWGEIDIIATKRGEYHFVEVKSVSCEMKNGTANFVSNDKYRAEDNIHPKKIARLKRAIQSYFGDRSFSPETLWAFDAIIVKIDMDKKKAVVNMIKDIIL